MQTWLAVLLSGILVFLLGAVITSNLYDLSHLSNKSSGYVSGFMAGFIALLTAISLGLMILWIRYFKQRHTR